MMPKHHKTTIDVDQSYGSANGMNLNVEISPVRIKNSNQDHLERSPRGPKMSVPVDGILEPVLEEERANLLVGSSQSDG